MVFFRCWRLLDSPFQKFSFVLRLLAMSAAASVSKSSNIVVVEIIDTHDLTWLFLFRTSRSKGIAPAERGEKEVTQGRACCGCSSHVHQATWQCLYTNTHEATLRRWVKLLDQCCIPKQWTGPDFIKLFKQIILLEKFLWWAKIEWGTSTM